MSLQEASEKPPKRGVAVEQHQAESFNSASNLESETVDPEMERKLLMTLDLHVCPLLMLLYLIAFLDRSNIGNAFSAGMDKDLGLPANGINVATSIFYVTYVTFESPLSTLLKRFRPSRLIPFIVVAWGLVVIGSGFVTNYGGLIATRLLLGAGEAALFPCLALYLTLFYKRTELAKRTCFLFVAAAISGAFGGLIASGLLDMNGIRGLYGWQWLYLIEGTITVAIGLCVPFLLPDNFESARYLNEDQKQIMRIRAAQTKTYMGENEHYFTEVKKALKDPSVWLSGSCQLGADICLYGYSVFLVTILKGMGFDTIKANLLTAPAYAWSAIVYFTVAYLSDRYQKRVIILVPAGLVSIIGYGILLGVHSSQAVQYFACFVVGTGIYVTVGLNLTWLNQNQSGFIKRSMALGLQQTIGNTGGIVAGQIYRSTNAPYYTIGHAVSLAAMSWAVIGFLLQTWLWKLKMAKKRSLSEKGKEQQDLDRVSGDSRHDFVYVW